MLSIYHITPLHGTGDIRCFSVVIMGACILHISAMAGSQGLLVMWMYIQPIDEKMASTHPTVYMLHAVQTAWASLARIPSVTFTYTVRCIVTDTNSSVYTHLKLIDRVVDDHLLNHMQFTLSLKINLCDYVPGKLSAEISAITQQAIIRSSVLAFTNNIFFISPVLCNSDFEDYCERESKISCKQRTRQTTIIREQETNNS